MKISRTSEDIIRGTKLSSRKHLQSVYPKVRRAKNVKKLYENTPLIPREIKSLE
jgi:hypothetical protein